MTDSESHRGGHRGEKAHQPPAELKRTHWHNRDQMNILEVLRLSVDTEKLTFSSHFNRFVAMTERRGEVVLELKGSFHSNKKIHIEVGEKGMARLRHIQHQHERSVSGAEAQSKGRGYDDLLKSMIETNAVMLISEALQDHGTVIKGEPKTVASMLDDLNNSLTGCFQDLVTKVSLSSEGADYIRRLLLSQDEERIAMGLNLLLAGSFVGVLEDEVEGIYRNRGIRSDLRQHAYATLTAETRREHARQAVAKRQGDMPES